MNKKLVIVGGGFAGISAVQVFSRFRRCAECMLIDRKDYFEFLPLLPDVIGGKIRSEFLRVSLPGLGRKLGFDFRKEVVEKVALPQKKIFTKNGPVDYDYLLVSCGSETNFYDNDAVGAGACKLDSVEDAERIAGKVDLDLYETYFISGGGYTGIEVAANLRMRLKKIEKRRRIIIVEGSPLLLGPLPGWMRGYAAAFLKRMEIEILVNTRVAGVEKDEVFLSTGERVSRSMLIWTAGVKTPDFLQRLDKRKTAQGRIVVDEHLKVDRFCFLAGDAASFDYAGKPLRMSVQFAFTEGRHAASSIIREIEGKEPMRYRPFDPGYILPMAEGGCGKALGANVRGRFALALHYLMSIYRSYGMKNRAGISGDLLKEHPIKVKLSKNGRKTDP
ncbi:MAG: FAD-dependent oxidoreductase [Candidatus Omnitrophota bacterium]